MTHSSEAQKITEKVLVEYKSKMNVDVAAQFSLPEEFRILDFDFVLVPK